MKRKPIKKKLFFFDIPIYEREICVIVGMSHTEAVKEAKRQKLNKSFVGALNWETAVELCNKVHDEESETEGAAVRVNDSSYMLFLKPFKNDWKYYDNLNHECFHITQFMSLILNIWDEKEPPAYLHTWIFKNLRRTLSGHQTP